MNSRFKYKRDKLSIRITILYLIAILTLFGFVVYVSPGSYFTAWFITLTTFVTLIYVLSIPRYIEVRDDSIEIHSLVELTVIYIEDVKSAKIITNREMRGSIPILGAFGFFGYYGYYLKLQKMKIFKVYAGSWSDFVEIEDLYGHIYVVSCDRGKELVDLIIDTKTEFLTRVEAA